jgi:dihydropteroate synthase
MAALRKLFPDLGRRTLIMGILNVTPDSFSDGGALRDVDAALDHALLMMDEGADLIDVGGESTRPGADPVPEHQEIERVLPVIRKLKSKGIGPLSIDTVKANVAHRAIDEGADMVNDVSALDFDPRMASVVAERRVPVVLMHARGRPKEMQKGPLVYEGGVVAAVADRLRSSLERAEREGIPREMIILDPGIGFGKTVEQNVELIAHVGTFKGLGRPVLIGPSRKSFLGALTGRDVHDRVYATAAAVAIAVREGVDIVRVHDVKAMLDVVKVAEATRNAAVAR